MVRDKILHKLNQHDKVFARHDEQFQQIDFRFEKVESRLDHHDLQFKAIINKLMDHDDRFEVLTSVIHDFREEFLQGQDAIMTILRRLDQERIFTTQWVKRIDDDVAEQKVIIREHDVVLGKVKAELNIA